jgi:tetratricopeptide (TPR) repeat protein
VLAEAQSWGAPHPNLDLLAGALMEALALDSRAAEVHGEALTSARAAFKRCLASSGQLFASRPLPGATSWAARTRLATLDLLTGRSIEALHGFEQVQRERPNLCEAHLGQIEARIDLGLAAEALRKLEPWLAGGSPDAWTLAASAAAALGSSSDAALFAERALDSSVGRSWISPHRRLRLEAVLGCAQRISGSSSA